MRVLVVPRRGLPVVATTMGYTVGSRDERTGETGLSHFLEHMMFKGTARYAKGEIDRLTSVLGGSNNASTSQDVTLYYFALAADRWQCALEIEASRMTGCTLDPDEFAAEKNVVLEEMAMGEDDPWSRLYHAVEAEAYRVHTYRHPIIGWRQDVEGVSVDAMRAFYERHYGPNRAFLVVVGDVAAKETIGQVERLFGALPPSAAPRDEVNAEPAPGGPRLCIEHFFAQTDVVRIAICMPTCRMDEDDDYALEVAGHVLGGAKSSRLYRRLVLEDQLATMVSVFNETRLDPGLFSVAIELRSGVDPAAAERVVEEEFDRLRRRGPTVGELRQAHTQLRAAHLFEAETVLDLAQRIARYEAAAVGGSAAMDRAAERCALVGKAEVKAVLARYAERRRWTVARLLPEPPSRSGRTGGRGAREVARQ